MMMPRERERNLDIHPSHPSWTDETETKSIERKRVDGDQMIPAPLIHPHVPCVGRMCVHFTPRGRAKKKNKIKKRTETMCCRPWSVRPSIHRQHPDTPAHHQSANGHFSLPCFPEKEIERRRRERYRYCCWKRYPVPPPPPPYLPLLSLTGFRHFWVTLGHKMIRQSDTRALFLLPVFVARRLDLHILLLLLLYIYVSFALLCTCVCLAEW